MDLSYCTSSHWKHCRLLGPFVHPFPRIEFITGSLCVVDLWVGPTYTGPTLHCGLGKTFSWKWVKDRRVQNKSKNLYVWKSYLSIQDVRNIFSCETKILIVSEENGGQSDPVRWCGQMQWLMEKNNNNGSDCSNGAGSGNCNWVRPRLMQTNCNPV